MVHSLNSVVNNILAVRHCAVSESGQEFGTVGRYGSDESIINKLLAPTDISADTDIRVVRSIKISQTITKLFVVDVYGYFFGVLDSNTMQCLDRLTYVDYLMEVVSHENLQYFVPERHWSF